MGNTAHCQAESGGQPIDGDASPQQSRDNFRGTGKRKKKGPWVCACRSGNCWGKIVWTLNRFHRGAERMELLRIESLGDGLSPSGTIQMEAHMADEMTKITSGSLIAADKVKGTDVYNADGEELGTVDDIMIDKISGKAIYAIMSFGGFLGMGEKYHPLPWSTLNYDESQGGYVVNLDKKVLERAPTYDMDEDFHWTPDYGRQVDRYYNAPT